MDRTARSSTAMSKFEMAMYRPLALAELWVSKYGGTLVAYANGGCGLELVVDEVLYTLVLHPEPKWLSVRFAVIMPRPPHDLARMHGTLARMNAEVEHPVCFICLPHDRLFLVTIPVLYVRDGYLGEMQFTSAVQAGMAAVKWLENEFALTPRRAQVTSLQYRPTQGSAC